MGAEKVAVAQILKDHNVLVRGGPEQGTKLMDALVVSCCCIVISTSSIFILSCALTAVHGSRNS